MRQSVIEFLRNKEILHKDATSFKLIFPDDRSVDLVDLIEEFTISQFDEDHALDKVLNSMVDELMWEYELELEYNTGSIEKVKLITDNIKFTIDQYSRNRDPFKYKVISKTLA